jgi:hypothetical protein
MGQNKRIRRGAAGWRKLISRQSSSGLSVPEYCRRESINASLFRRWQLRLMGSQPGGDVSTGRPLAVEDAAPFIDLGELRSGRSRMQVRLDLGGGIVLSIARG